MEGLSQAERERLESWGLLSQIARQRGAGSGVAGLPGSALPAAWAPDVELEYQRLRAAYEALRRAAEAGAVDPSGHERFRADARALLRRVES